MGEFSPPFSEPPSFFLFSYPSNIEIIFDFSDIVTKIHPFFQTLGSALVLLIQCQAESKENLQLGN